MEKKPIIILGLSIAIGLIVLGVCINLGLNSFSAKERIVTVKGLAEKQIKANTVELKITSQVSGDYPNELIKNLDAEVERVRKILSQKKYRNVTVSELNYYDSKQYYRNEWDGRENVKVKVDRYYLSKKTGITIKDVENAETIKQELLLAFINAGMTCDIFVEYNFPEVNDYKSELIAESTKNARISGEQFANDSKSKLGKIKTASQGQITIAGRYYDSEDGGPTNMPEHPYYEKVRVVSTIVFFLED